MVKHCLTLHFPFKRAIVDTQMGHTYIDVNLASPVTGENVTINALVDTGATTTTIPKDLADKLNLPEITRRRVVTASGEEDMPVSYIMVDISGEKTVTDVLISAKLNRVLIGVTTLESLAFKVNPKTGKLEKTEVLLLSTIS